MQHKTGATNSGFTVIELMISMAIGFSSLHIAIVSGQSMMTNNRLAINANRMIQDLRTARSHAILQNMRVTISKTGDHWENGWIVFEDFNGNAQLDSNERLLREQEALRGSLTLRGNRYVADYVSYNGRGLSRRTTGGIQAGTLLLCDETGQANPDHARAIIISSSGRPRTSKEVADFKNKSCGT